MNKSNGQIAKNRDSGAFIAFQWQTFICLPFQLVVV
jgi:hypothetical protein